MAFPYPYVGPIAPYNNLPIESQNYQPQVFFISNIVLGQSTTVTMTTNHNYVIGQECRLLIPQGNGCRQLNEITGFVISIPAANQVTLNIDSSVNVDPFQTSTFTIKPQIVAMGDVNTGAINASGRSMTSTIVPGSFINISP
jgi:hypothetical protein